MPAIRDFIFVEELKFFGLEKDTVELGFADTQFLISEFLESAGAQILVTQQFGEIFR